MLKWLHHLLNPHCEHCAQERRERKVCDSCETLRQELAYERHEKEILLSRLLEKPESPKEESKPVMNTRPTAVPWRVRQQMLEQEDRAKAKLMRDAQKTLEVDKKSEEEFEKEFNEVVKENATATATN